MGAGRGAAPGAPAGMHLPETRTAAPAKEPSFANILADLSEFASGVADAANSELQMLRLELNLLRPHEVPPLPSAAPTATPAPTATAAPSRESRRANAWSCSQLFALAAELRPASKLRASMSAGK